MNKIFHKLALGITLTCLGVAATSCEEEAESLLTEDYTSNFFYATSVTTNHHVSKFYGNGTITLPETENIAIAKCSKAAAGNITVKFEIDPTLVDEYNAKNETSYEFLASAKLSTSSLVIKNGEYESADTVKLQYTNLKDLFTEEKQFIVPVRISSIDGEGKVSEKSIEYYTYAQKEVMVETLSEAYGIKANGSDFSFYLNGEQTSRATGYKQIGDEIVIDFGRLLDLCCFTVTSYSSSYCITGFDLAISTDNENWESCGYVDFGGYKSSATFGFYNGDFYSRDARYVRIIVRDGKSGSNANQVYISAFSWYEKE